MQDGRAIQTQPYTVAGYQCGSGSPPIPWANLNGEERRYVHSGVGWNNWHTLGILLVGLVPTAAQLATARWLIHKKIPARLKKFLPPIPHTVISMGTTPCPGANYAAWWPKIL